MPKFFMNYLGIGVLLVSITLALSQCGEDDAIDSTPVRAVKTVTIGESVDDVIRQYSGVVAAADISQLSFQVPGNVREVLASQGDTVQEGQMLARLDQTNYNIALQSAEATLTERKAILSERKQEFERQEALEKRGFVSKAGLQKAEAEFKSAESGVEVAQANVDKAKRDLSMTDLKAPFKGRIASRMIEPFVEVTAGQPIFELHGEDGFEVEVFVPERVFHEIQKDQDALVHFQTLGKHDIKGRVKEVGSKAEKGNAFPIRIEVLELIPQLRQGMSAEVTFSFKGAPSSDQVVLVPFHAVLFETELTPEHHDGFVFLYDVSQSVVHKHPVKVKDVRGNMLEVYEGLKIGDTVVTAGVHFLKDGQKVSLYKEKNETLEKGSPATSNPAP